MNDEQFERFLQGCVAELQAKQADLLARFPALQSGQWSLNHDNDELTITDVQGAKSRFRVCPIGTWASQQETWKWAWANGKLHAPVREQAAHVKHLAGMTDYGFFIEEAPFAADEQMAWELSAMSVFHSRSLGCFCARNQTTYLYLAIEAALVN